MKEIVSDMGPMLVTAAYVAAGAGLGLAVGLLGRVALGFVVAGLLAAVLLGLTESYVGFVGSAFASVPRGDVIVFLSTTAGIMTMAGFLAGLWIAARRGR